MRGLIARTIESASSSVTSPARATAVDPPAAAHSEVGVERQVAVEADEQVLAAGVDRSNGTAGEPLGPVIEGVPRLRSLDLADRPAHERLAHSARGVVDRVP